LSVPLLLEATVDTYKSTWCSNEGPAWLNEVVERKKPTSQCYFFGFFSPIYPTYGHTKLNKNEIKIYNTQNENPKKSHNRIKENFVCNV
jgi:hypothetical protein